MLSLRGFFSALAVPSLVVLILAVLHWEGFFRIDDVIVSFAEPPSRPATVATRDSSRNPLPDWLGPQWTEAREELQKWRGHDLMTVEFRTIEREILRHPWVNEVHLWRGWPHLLMVQLSYKNLVAYARTPKGNLLGVLEDGTSLSLPENQPKYDLPVLNPELSQALQFSADAEMKQKLITALDLLRTVPPEKELQTASAEQPSPRRASLNRERITEIGYDSKDGFWLLILPFATRIKFGERGHQAAAAFNSSDSSDFDFAQRVARVQQVLDYLDSRQIEARVIDANLAKKVVVRLRKTP